MMTTNFEKIIYLPQVNPTFKTRVWTLKNHLKILLVWLKVTKKSITGVLKLSYLIKLVEKVMEASGYIWAVCTARVRGGGVHMLCGHWPIFGKYENITFYAKLLWTLLFLLYALWIFPKQKSVAMWHFLNKESLQLKESFEIENYW